MTTCEWNSLMQNEGDLIVLPVRNTKFFVFSSTYTGILLSQMILSGAKVSLSLIWSGFLLACGLQFLYICFLLYIAYRSIKEKPIEPFIFLQQKNVVDEDESDLIS